MRWTEGGQPDHLTFAGLRGGGKGGSTQQSSNQSGTSTTYVPQWLDTASQGALTQAQGLAAQPYTPYTGQLVADPTAATKAAYAGVGAMQGTGMPQYQAAQNAYQGLLGSAAPVTADQINQLSNQIYGGYNQNVVQPTQGLLSNYLQGAGPATAGQVGSNAMQLMSPYEQAVINPALQAGQQQLALANQQIAGQAVNAGAFGGTRQGVQQGVAEAQTALGTGQAIGNLLNQGWQANITPAYNLANLQSTQGYNAAALLGQLGQQGYGAAMQQAGTVGANNLSAGLAAAQNLPQATNAQQAALQTQLGLLSAAGLQQQQQAQSYDTAALSQFQQQQAYPYQSLDTILSTIGALPYGTTTNTTGTGMGQQTTTPGMGADIAGGIGTATSIAGVVALI